MIILFENPSITITVILLITLLFCVVVLYTSYAGVISARNQLDEALAGIDVQLKRRADLVPNVLKIAQRFMVHEREIFTEITKLRTEVLEHPVGTAERFAGEEKLHEALRQLVVTVENYPQLKSDSAMVKAMETYSDVEDNIAASRRFYNTALRELKNRIQIFPGTLFKSNAGDISVFDYYSCSNEDRKVVDVKDYL